MAKWYLNDLFTNCLVNKLSMDNVSFRRQDNVSLYTSEAESLPTAKPGKRLSIFVKLSKILVISNRMQLKSMTIIWPVLL